MMKMLTIITIIITIIIIMIILDIIVFLEIPFSKNAYHIKTSQLICNAFLTGFYTIRFLLKGLS